MTGPTNTNRWILTAILILFCACLALVAANPAHTGNTAPLPGPDGSTNRVSSQQQQYLIVPSSIEVRAHYNEMGQRSLHVDWSNYWNNHADHLIKFKLRYRPYLDGTDGELNEGQGWQEYALSRETPSSDPSSDVSHAVIPNVPWLPIPYEVQVQAIKVHETTGVTETSAWSRSGVQEVVLTVDDVTAPEGPAEVRITAVPAMQSAGQVRVSAVALPSDTTDNAATTGARCRLGHDCPLLSEFTPRETDFVPNTGTISYGIGDTSKSFTLIVAGDQIPEGPEKFHVNLESLGTSSRLTLVQKQAGSNSANYEDYGDARYQRQITVTIRDNDEDTPPRLAEPTPLPDLIGFVGEEGVWGLPHVLKGSGNGPIYDFALVNSDDGADFDTNGLTFGVNYHEDTQSFEPFVTGTPVEAATHEVIFQVHDTDGSLGPEDCACYRLRIKVLPGHLEVTGSDPVSDTPEPYEINLNRGAPFPCDQGQCRPWTVVKHISEPTRYTISIDQSIGRPWLRATPGSEGPMAGSENPVELALTPEAANLALGIHEATLTFTEHFEGVHMNVPFSRDLVVATRTVRANVQDDRPPTVADIPDYSFPVVRSGPYPTEYITLPAADAGSGNGAPYAYEVLLEDDSGGLTPITEASPTTGIVIFYPDTSRLGISHQFGGEIYNLVYRVHDGDNNQQDSDAADVRFRISMPLNSAPQFASAPTDLTFGVGQAVDEILPLAVDGSGDGGPYAYSLTYRDGSVFPGANGLGLTFDAATRRLSGTTTGEGALQVTYRVHDNDRWRAAFDSAAANFDILVTSARVVSIAPGPSPITEGGHAEFVLTASPAPASDLTVNLNVTQSGDFAAASDIGAATATIRAGDATTTHRVATVNDNTDEANGSVTATITGAAGGYATGTPSSATVTVNDNDDAIARVVSIAPGPSPITEGGQAEFVLTASPAPASDLTVNLNVTQSGDFAAASDIGAATATIRAGDATTTHRVATVNDNTDEANGSVTATITGAAGGYATGTPSSATVTVNDNDDAIARVVSIAPGPSPITEGGQAEFVLTASPAPASDLTVNLNVTQSGDFAAASDIGAATATIRAGDATTTHRVATVNDNTDEANGSVTATITGAAGGYAAGAANSATVNVADNDETALPKVTGLKVTGAAGSLRMSWRAASGAGGYKVQWKSGGASYGTDREAPVGTSTEYTISGLTADEIHTVRVEATKFGASGPWSDEQRGIPTQSCTGTGRLNAGPDVLVVLGGSVVLDGSCSAAGGSRILWYPDADGVSISIKIVDGNPMKIALSAFDRVYDAGDKVCVVLSATYDGERLTDTTCVTVQSP